jgi:Squalene epoxidase
MQEACFEYFKLGGQAVDGPMSLLSGYAWSTEWSMVFLSSASCWFPFEDSPALLLLAFPPSLPFSLCLS